jgi:hypothetical protein
VDLPFGPPFKGKFRLPPEHDPLYERLAIPFNPSRKQNANTKK